MTEVPEVPAPLALPSPAPAGEHDAAGPRGSTRRPGRLRSGLSVLRRRLRKESL
ncbi:hypothetical protein [Catenulispora acidiphila]|uniref:hypothetical protein n=1 Tax=Catenulispora acidiphila TaxID=304895 RepID=UPI00167FDED1|nr:hypothetical protein [Catenulispora acidiphila]